MKKTISKNQTNPIRKVLAFLFMSNNNALKKSLKTPKLV